MSEVESPMPDERFVSIGRAAHIIGIAEPTLRRKVRESRLAVFSDPRDKRRKLLRIADLDRFKVVEAVDDAGSEAGCVA